MELLLRAVGVSEVVRNEADVEESTMLFLRQDTPVSGFHKVTKVVVAGDVVSSYIKFLSVSVGKKNKSLVTMLSKPPQNLEHLFHSPCAKDHESRYK